MPLISCRREAALPCSDRYEPRENPKRQQRSEFRQWAQAIAGAEPSRRASLAALARRGDLASLDDFTPCDASAREEAKPGKPGLP